VVTDFTHREALGKLLRYETSGLPKGTKTSLADYVKRMTSEQTEIYFILSPNREAAESSPYYEVFQAKKFEVLFLYDPWDEFVMEHLADFDGKPLRAAEKAELKLEDTKSDAAEQLNDEQAADLAKWLKETLGERVGEVRPSKRLVDSPAVVVDSDKHMTASMRRILKSMNQASGEEKYDFEINQRHVVMARLEKMRGNDAALAAKVAEQLLDNARVAAGLLEDPRTMVKRLNELMAQMLSGK
jgi:TNF receptor-associated protein 1